MGDVARRALMSVAASAATLFCDSFVRIFWCRPSANASIHKRVLAVWLVVGSWFIGSTQAEPLIGDERVHRQPLVHETVAAMPFADIVAYGGHLFSAKFTILDGAGRPGATQSEIPTKRLSGELPAFFRTSGPEANACDGCHNQPSVGGAGEFVANVFVSDGVDDADFDSLDPQFSNERGTPAIHGAGLVELLAREMTRDLQALRDDGAERSRRTGRPVTVALVSKGVSFGHITLHPSGYADVNGIDGVDHDLVIRPFSQKGVFSSLRQFTINALNAHHGMQARERFGVTWTGTADFDRDGIADEIRSGDVTALVLFQAALPFPVQRFSENATLKAAAEDGAQLFTEAACDTCHRHALPLEAPVFVEPNPLNTAGNLRSTDGATPVKVALDTAGLKRNDEGHWLIPLFSDLKRHRIADDARPYFANELLGQRFVGRDVFLTPRLWGAGTTAPYGHRGDLTTLREAILHHGGDANTSREKFEALTELQQAKVIEFLKSLQIPSGGAS